MIENYEIKKENGLIETKELESGTVEVTEKQFNSLTGKKEVVNTYQTSAQQIENLIVDNDNQLKAVQKRGTSLKAMQSDLGFKPTSKKE